MAIQNNEMSPFAMQDTSLGEDEKGKIKRSLGDKKFATDGGVAQLYISSDFISMTFTSNGVVVTNGGVLLAGKEITLGAKPSDVRIGTYWKFNDDLLTCLPSTVFTPIPVLKWSVPDFSKQALYKMEVLAKLGIV